MGSMMTLTWGHMLWIFFPIPLFCLLLLTVPSAEADFERSGTGLVGKIFFRGLRMGPLGEARLVHVFIGASLLIFYAASNTVRRGFDGVHDPDCGGEATCEMWHRRAVRHRAERNFWLSLLTLVLWLLVYKIFMLREEIVRLRGNADGSNLKRDGSKKGK